MLVQHPGAQRIRAKRSRGIIDKSPVAGGFKPNRESKARGVTGVRQSRRGRFCFACEGMSWRRPLKGKCHCGERYAPESNAIARAQSTQRRAYPLPT